MDDLVAFLNARLDERQRDVFSRRATVHAHTCDGFPALGTPSGYSEGRTSMREIDNCTCGGPESALREIEAGRAILELHSGAHECPAYDHNGDIDNCAWWPEGDCTTLRLRVAVYSGHPGYRQEWKS